MAESVGSLALPHELFAAILEGVSVSLHHGNSPNSMNAKATG